MQPVNTLIRTAEFAEWLRQLKDAKGKARIIKRAIRMARELENER